MAARPQSPSRHAGCPPQSLGICRAICGGRHDARSAPFRRIYIHSIHHSDGDERLSGTLASSSVLCFHQRSSR